MVIFVVLKITCYGHKNIMATHQTTLEVTRDKEITKRADCIVGVKADKGIVDLSNEFKRRARERDSIIKVILRVDGMKETIIGRGHEELTFLHPNDIVLRKSTFTCPRTLMIKADKGAVDLDREFVKKLKDGKKMVVEISVE